MPVLARAHRRSFAALAVLLFLIEVAIAHWVRSGPVRAYVGDGLAVILLFCTLMAATRLSPLGANLAALAIAVSIEFGQAFDLLGRLGLDHVALARILLGSHFDPNDFLAYAAGSALVALMSGAPAPVGGRLPR